MNNHVTYSPEFKKTLKPLAKKYRTLKDTIKDLEEDLIADPFIGESYGDNIYKIRRGDESKGKGKSGGFRIMYYLIVESKDGIEILLLTIFDKSDKYTIKKNAAVRLKDRVLERMKQSGSK